LEYFFTGSLDQNSPEKNVEEYASNRRHLEKISLTNIGLSNKLAPVFEQIKTERRQEYNTNESMELDISNNNLGDKGLGAFGDFIGSGGGRVEWIQSLEMRDMGCDLFAFFSKIFDSFASTESGNRSILPRLVRLDISSNSISAKAAESFSHLLSLAAFPNLDELKISVT
jgi:hypothetical protein